MARFFRLCMVVLGVLVVIVTSDLYAARRAPTTVTRLRGAAAREYIENMHRRNPRMRADYDTNAREFRARGWKPTSGEYDVVEIQRRQKLPLQRVVSLVVPTLVAQSFDLGDGTSLTLSPWDAGDPDLFASVVTISGAGEWQTGAVITRISSSAVEWADQLWVRRWAICTFGGCVGVGVTCFLTGPGWAACTAPRCAGAMAACGAREFAQYLCGKRYMGC